MANKVPENDIELDRVDVQESSNPIHDAGPLVEVFDKNDENLRFDILDQSINENYLINLTKENFKNIKNEAKRNCKILKFSSDFNLDEIVTTLSNLNSEEYPKLFIFIIDVDYFDLVESSTDVNSKNSKFFDKFLLIFGKSRPIVMQVASKNANTTTFYYKQENSMKFLSIDQQNKNFEVHQNFPTLFMAIVSGKIEDFDKSMTEKLLNAENSCLILRFIWILELSEYFLGLLILKCPEKGTKEQLLAALDDSFDSKGKMLSIDAQDYICYSYTLENDIEQSILLVAVQNGNKEIVDFLIENFTHLIQQLPHSHKIEICTAAYTSNQIKMLCDLLQVSDFPFPKNFDSNSIVNERLQLIVDERKKFHDAISKLDDEAIEKIIDDNSDLKFAFDVENKSALNHALSSKSFNVFFHLKSLGFQATENVNYEEILDGEELKQARVAALNQMRENVITSISHEHKSVMILSSKSSIHNKRLKKDVDENYRRKIQQWFSEISKTFSGSDMVNAASQCEKLKFIFDFESDVVSNISLKDKGASGTTYPNYKWIFVGAKMPTERSQEIKGVIAHELCHYVMRLVFENNEYPYYKNDADARTDLEDISKEIDVWTAQDPNDEEVIDDECDGIISTVFRLYDKEDWHAELIVRVPHILAQFDDDLEKMAYLRTKFKRLFDFHELRVVPEMRRLCSKNRKFNKLAALLPEIESSDIEFETSKDLTTINSNKIVTVVSNIPKLLLVDIYQQSCAVAQKPFIDDSNIFITSGILKNSEIVSEFEHILREQNGMNIYIDCTKEIGSNLGPLFSNQTHKLIFIVGSERQCEVLMDLFKRSKKEAIDAVVNFKWSDLSAKCQIKFIQFGLTFQNGRTCLYGLMTKEVVEGEIKNREELKVAKELNEVVNDQLLNLLVENSKISINQEFFEKFCNDISFVLLFKSRKFIKNFSNNNEKSGVEISEDELLDIKDQKYFLISDIAGTGKSWAMRNIAKLLTQKFGTCWVTYVDLKEFISAFKSINSVTNFLTFMIEIVLKNHQNFESKIFTKLYKIGKVFVIFDGFDEISPNYYELVMNIIKSFESNGGNRMFIATRDFFEVDLQEQLKIDVAFKLDKFTEQDGIDLITSIWVLKEIGSDTKDLRTSPNFEKHQEKARKLIEKISRLHFDSIGFPQFYKMAAEIFKNDKFIGYDLNIFKIYREFSLIQIERWSHEKGEVRKMASVSAHTKATSFTEVHQFLAMKSLFPDEEEFCDLEYDEDDWPDTEIIGCGLATKVNGNFIFLHETFREFFGAEFILGNLSKAKTDSLTFLIKFVTNQKFEVIRMFINDALKDETIVKKIKSKMQKLTKLFDKNVSGCEDISFVFRENLPSLANFLIDMLTKLDYEKVKEILHNNVSKIVSSAPKNFTKFQEFFIEILSVDDLKDFAVKHNILREMTKSWFDAEDILEFLDKIDEKTNIARSLLSTKDVEERNYFLFLCSYNVRDIKKFTKLFDTLKYFTTSEMLELLQECDAIEKNILHICVDCGQPEKLDFLWTNIFMAKNFSQNFRELFKQDIGGLNGLYYAVTCEESKFHESLWKILLEAYKNHDELIDLIFPKKPNQDNFIHFVIKKSTPEIIELTFKSLKTKLIEFPEMVMTKSILGQNVLETAVVCSEDIKTHQVLWNIICESKEITKKFINEQGMNIFHYAAIFSTCEVLEFLTQQLEHEFSHDEIKVLLNVSGIEGLNILQLAAMFNRSTDFHQKLWEIFNKYFDQPEMFEFICRKNKFGQNAFEAALDKNTCQVVQLNWNEVKKFLNGSELEELKNQCDFIIENSLKSDKLEESSKDILKTNFNKLLQNSNSMHKTLLN